MAIQAMFLLPTQSMVAVDQPKLDPKAQKKINEELFYAVSRQKGKEKLEQLIKGGGQVNSTFEGRTLLYTAIARGNEATVATLIEHGADVKQTSKDPTTVVHPEKLVTRGRLTYPVQTGETNVWTPLDKAVGTGNVRIVGLLLKHGADPNRASRGKTPLDWAIIKGSRDVVSFLVKHGASVTKGKPLLQAASRKDVVIAELLLKHGAKVNVGGGVIHSRDVIHSPFIEAIYKGDSKMVELLLKHGANATQGLKFAIWRNDVKLAGLLLKYDAKISDRYMITAADRGSAELIKILLTHVAPSGCSSDCLGGALFSAVWRNYFDMVTLLLKHGAKITATVLDNPHYYKSGLAHLIDKIGRFMKNHFVPFLKRGIEAGRLEMAELFLKQGMDAQTKNSALKYAVDSKDIKVAEIVLQYAKPHVEQKDSALKSAVESKNTKMAELLLKYGAKGRQGFLGRELIRIAKKNKDKAMLALLQKSK